MDSAAIRKEMIARRDALSPEERTRLSEEICRRIAASELFRSARTVLAYRGMRGELRLDALFSAPEAAGKRFVFPRCITRTEMTALCPQGPDAWARSGFGILEPVPERSDEIGPEEIDLVLCPCTAFDERCARIGMGAGYYDRYLPQCVNARVAAVAFECQKVPRIEAKPWDFPMEAVFTEDRIYTAPSRC